MQNAHAKAMLAGFMHACMQPISEAFNFIYIDIKKLQQDIDDLLNQSEVCLIPFSISKCKSLNLGNCNPRSFINMDIITSQEGSYRSY